MNIATITHIKCNNLIRKIWFRLLVHLEFSSVDKLALSQQQSVVAKQLYCLVVQPMGHQLLDPVSYNTNTVH